MIYSFLLIDKDKNSVEMKLTYEEAKELTKLYDIKKAKRNRTRSNLDKEIIRYLRANKNL